MWTLDNIVFTDDKKAEQLRQKIVAKAKEIKEPLIEKAEYKDLFIYGNRKHKNCIVLYFVGSKKPKIISVRSIAKGIKTDNNAKRIAEYINKSNVGEPYKG